MLVVLFFVTPWLHLHAQRASVEFSSAYVSSVVQIIPSAIDHNGATTPITFNPVTSHNPKLGRDVTFIISTTPIAVNAYRSIVIDLHGAITVFQDGPFPPYASKTQRQTYNVLETSIEVINAETGTLLQNDLGFTASLKNANPGDDTTTSRQVTIEMSNINAKSIILRFAGTSMLTYNPFPHISIDNTLRAEIDRVH